MPLDNNSSSIDECSDNIVNSVEFVSGWVAETLETGVQPSYGYPKNHLPKVDDNFEMEVSTGFMAH